MNHESEFPLGAYALGTLENVERRRVENHLEGCEHCQAALASYEALAEGLLFAPEPQQPSRRVRSRLSKRISQRKELPRWRTRLRAVPAVGLVIAIGLFLLLVGNLRLLIQSQQLLEDSQTALVQQQVGQTAAAIVSYPSSQVAVIEEDSVRGTLVYDPGLPVGVMYVWGLQAPPEDQAYQAWLVDDDGKRTSGGLLTFSTDPGFGWLLIEAPTPITEFASLGVTLEPAGGSEAPTGPRILGTDL